MKKILAILSLTAITGALVVGASLKNNVKESKEAKADAPSYTTYVPLTDGWVEATDGSAGKSVNDLLRGRNDRFWNGNGDQNNWDSQERTFNGMDDFVDTIHRAGGEGWRGAYRTPELTLVDNDHRYISFLFGGGAKGDEGDIFVNVYHVRYASGSEDFPEGYERNVIKEERTFFDGSGSFDDKTAKLNAPRSCNMTFRYYRLPDSIGVGDKYLIYVRDGKTANYGGFTFGDVHINQTLEDCARSFSAHKAQMKLNEFTSDWNRNANESVLNFYATDSYYGDVRDAEALLTDANDGFEINNRLSKWAYDQENSTNNDGGLISINYSGIYSSTDFKDWRQKQPANKTGNLYLNADTSGIDEASKYRLVSNKFKLSGTGLVSIKLGGKTSKIQLLNADTLEELDSVINPTFLDGDANNIISSGTRQNTMTRVYIDWSAYLYSTTSTYVRIAISDYRTGGDWGLAYFDELITRYDNYPALKLDVITQEGETDLGNGNWENHDPYNGVVFNHFVDNGVVSDFSKAYSFLNNYYQKLRASGNSFSWCEDYSGEDIQGVITTYNGLESGVKTIVDASDDFSYGKYSNDYFLNEVLLDTVANSVNAVKAKMAAPANFSTIVNASNSISLIAIFGSLILILAMAAFFLKKKKQN